MNIQFKQIQFKDDFLEVIKIAGYRAVDKVENEYYVSVKKVCENLGIDFKRQKEKLKSDETFEARLIKAPTTGGVQEVFCIPLDKLNGWLFTINPNKVKAEAKEKLIAYKKECFNVLYNHFINKAKTQTQKNLFNEVDDKVIEELIKRSDIVSGYKGMIARLENELAKKQSEIINLKTKLNEIDILGEFVYQQWKKEQANNQKLIKLLQPLQRLNKIQNEIMQEVTLFEIGFEKDKYKIDERLKSRIKGMKNETLNTYNRKNG